MMFLNRNWEEPVNRCFSCYFLNVSVKNYRSSHPEVFCEEVFLKIIQIIKNYHRKAPVPKSLEDGYVQRYKKDSDHGLF